jgi:thioester reductase-like protein
MASETGGDSFLLTGFPGFIGARLLPRLLELMPASTACCLVQERFRAQAETEVASIERRFPHAQGRMRLLEGDITAPRLGLTNSVIEVLERELTSAYHLAAVYDLTVSR